MIHTARPLLSAVLMLVLSACGSGLSGWSQANGCSENNDSCSLQCPADGSCGGTCGESCSASCTEGSTCSLTVGPSSSVSCSNATCHIICTGSCSVSCTNSTCDLTCPSDTQPRTITASGSCS
ncbi:MAG: hypothetical protein M3Y59_25090 [Myxococcota bacterium]|nr:hypothetical protein [Myxococcota bacterium]